jgi:hypothetical protein
VITMPAVSTSQSENQDISQTQSKRAGSEHILDAPACGVNLSGLRFAIAWGERRNFPGPLVAATKGHERVKATASRTLY